MGSVYRRKHKHKTTWCISYYVKGKHIRKKIGRSRALAEKVLGGIEAKIERQEEGLLPRDYDIKKYFSEYLVHLEHSISESYQKRLINVKQNFYRYLAGHPNIKRLSQITPVFIAGYKTFRRDEKERGVKKRTLNIEVGAIKTMLNRAVKWEYIDVNPLRNVDLLKEDDSKKMRALTKDEVTALLKESSPWFYAVVYTVLFAGLRLEEVRHLEWDDVDFKAHRIHIRRKEKWIPKSSGKKIRERLIPINDHIVEFLAKHRRKTKSKEDNYVFHAPDGGQLKKNLRGAFISTAKRAGIKDVTQFHALRHTYGTHAARSGVDLVTLKAAMGHAKIETTMRYAQPLDDHMTKVVGKIKYD